MGNAKETLMGNAKEPLMHAINPIKTDGQAALVEWTEGGIPHRRIVPAAAIFDNACPPEVLDEGIPYGLARSDLVELSASATALEENLHKAGILTGAEESNMATEPYALTQEMGAVWIQPEGPNTKPYYLGCVDGGDVAETFKTIEYGYCRQPDGSWKTISRSSGAPEKITTSIDKILFPDKDRLDALANCPVVLHFLGRAAG